MRFAPPDRAIGTVLHFHGGAFRLGCPEQIGSFAAELAARCHVTVICPAYRLAPEHPFPAGLADAQSVMNALISSGEGRLVISGDSAGGGLAAGLAAISDQTSLRLAGLALLSPWLDLAVTNPSFVINAASDPLFSAESARIAAEFYLQGLSAEHPIASPLHGQTAGYPPTFINVGTGEVLLDDARLLHARLSAAGVAVQFHPVEGMEHVAVTRDRTLPGSAETFDILAGFIDQILADSD